MPDLDLSALRAKAEAATPGPWTQDGHHMSLVIKCTAERGSPSARHLCGDYITVADAGENWMVDAAFIAAANPAVVLALIAEINLCHARLEIDHVWQVEDGETVQKYVPYAERVTIPDGIECRDATIHLHEERNKEAEAEITRLRSLLTRAGEALAPFASEANAWHSQLPSSRRVEVFAGVSREDSSFTVGDLRTARDVADEIKEALNND